MRVIADCETNGLEGCTELWLIVCKDIDTGIVYTFPHPTQSSDFIAFASNVTLWIGHNFLGFDAPVINRLLRSDVIDLDTVTDTLVVSRMADYQMEGHSLEAWGVRLRYPKGDFNDWNQYSPEMLAYCIQDVELNYKVYLHFKQLIDSPLWQRSLKTEHAMVTISREMHDNGFYFDIDEARRIYDEIIGQLDPLDNELRRSFPPRLKFIREVHPRTTKHGTLSRTDFRWKTDGDLSDFSEGATFSLCEWEEFNPGSTRQIVERLNAAGWKPYEKTKGHIQCERDLNDHRTRGEVRELAAAKIDHYRQLGWKVSKDNLDTLPADAPAPARRLVLRLLLAARARTLTEWFNAYNPVTHRIHGTFNHIGAWTHRMSHNGPNMANVPTEDPQHLDRSIYSNAMRALWSVPVGRNLIGVDAEGIQLRILAHYMNDPAFIFAVTSGSKEDGTDPHTLNKNALGHVCKSRDDAKTFIYAFLLGAGTGKIASILGCTLAEAKVAKDNFIAAYPGLLHLKQTIIPADAAAGYFKGFDGRFVKCNSEHHMLAGYLQNGESVIMKEARVLWGKELKRLQIPFLPVNFVHDEWQTEACDDLDTCKQIASVQADAIRQVGESLNLNCPMAGSYLNSHKSLAIGANWSLTH
ncbi:DNA polymerase [Bradyrhizobium erythrophlei]|uniref:DNA-directed DNA polymerase n=1 Tax=Bradyrhizobium erythrophlei TaxID=1437360 RepID=A0A1M5TAT9_9BRAD|nr:DNA polymerase [Bradyrhizobium erythrophlei]SHH47821.1 DNA polymerase I-3'-5' exonuclease and polymerase domains [Bradyrhizobium erythrophlei]